jgi:hypothetical protein
MAKLPTKFQLSKLSRTALVAYAVRCARRVQPLFMVREHDQEVEKQNIGLFIIEANNALRVVENWLRTPENVSSQALHKAYADLEERKSQYKAKPSPPFLKTGQKRIINSLINMIPRVIEAAAFPSNTISAVSSFAVSASELSAI